MQLIYLNMKSVQFQSFCADFLTNLFSSCVKLNHDLFCLFVLLCFVLDCSVDLQGNGAW